MEGRSGKCDENLIGADNLWKKILFLNKSLCQAHHEHSNLFAERSEVYFEIKLYHQCLENIKLARQNSSASAHEETLKQREEDCKTSIKQLPHTSITNPWKFFKLSHQSHDKIPFICDYLRPHETWKFGRCILTTKSLDPGDVIAIEEPLFRMLNKDARYSRCANCFISNAMSLIPCQGKCSTSKIFKEFFCNCV